MKNKGKDKKKEVSTQPVRDPADVLARQKERLAYLKKVNPKSPEIVELQKKIASGGKPVADTGGAGGGTEGQGVSKGSIEDFLGGIFSNFKPIDFEGAPEILSAGDLEKTRQENQDALYAENTQYLDRNRARSMEEAKQEMANRGIPYDPAAAFDPNSKNLYGRTIGAIDEQYKTEQQRALESARLGADQRLGTQVAANKTAYDSFIDTATKSYTSQLDAANTGNSVLNTLMQEYGLTKEEAIQRLKIKTDKEIANAQIAASNRKSGGGSGGGGAGFEII